MGSGGVGTGQLKVSQCLTPAYCRPTQLTKSRSTILLLLLLLLSDVELNIARSHDVCKFHLAALSAPIASASDYNCDHACRPWVHCVVFQCYYVLSRFSIYRITAHRTDNSLQ